MSSEDTTPQQLPGHLVHLIATEVSKVYRQWHAMPNRDAYVGLMMDQAACAAVNALLAGRVVVDLPEPDEKHDRAGGPERVFHVGSADVWNTWTDGEPRIRMTQRASGSGVHFSPDDARSFAAAILAAADASERLSVPGSSGEASRA